MSPLTPTTELLICNETYVLHIFSQGSGSIAKEGSETGLQKEGQGYQPRVFWSSVKIQDQWDALFLGNEKKCVRTGH